MSMEVGSGQGRGFRDCALQVLCNAYSPIICLGACHPAAVWRGGLHLKGTFGSCTMKVADIVVSQLPQASGFGLCMRLSNRYPACSNHCMLLRVVADPSGVPSAPRAHSTVPVCRGVIPAKLAAGHFLGVYGNELWVFPGPRNHNMRRVYCLDLLRYR